nr:hypothetical protein [Ferrimicrobium acidiphilum]
MYVTHRRKSLEDFYVGTGKAALGQDLWEVFSVVTLHHDLPVLVSTSDRELTLQLRAELVHLTVA